MQITLKLYATLTPHLPAGARRNVATLEVADGASVAGVIDDLHLPPALVHLVLVNGSFVDPEDRAARVLRAGDALAVWPPVAGG